MKIAQDITVAGLPAYRIRSLLRQSGKTLVWPLCCYPAYARPSGLTARRGAENFS